MRAYGSTSLTVTSERSIPANFVWRDEALVNWWMNESGTRRNVKEGLGLRFGGGCLHVVGVREEVAGRCDPGIRSVAHGEVSRRGGGVDVACEGVDGAVVVDERRQAARCHVLSFFLKNKTLADKEGRVLFHFDQFASFCVGLGEGFARWGPDLWCAALVSLGRTLRFHTGSARHLGGRGGTSLTSPCCDQRRGRVRSIHQR